MKTPMELFESVGFNIKYFVNNSNTFPYFVYYENGSNNFGADNEVYNSENKYIIEYYFKKKNEKLEKEIENIFNQNKIYWEKTEDIYINDEKVFMIRYFY